MIYSFVLSGVTVLVYDLPIVEPTFDVLAYSFATNRKTCKNISCSSCPIYSDGNCAAELRQTILNQPNFISNFPEYLV